MGDVVSAWDDAPLALLEAVDALVENELMYELGECIQLPPRELGGRPRNYPRYAVFLYCGLLTIFRSARRVETEMAYPAMWNHIRDRVQQKWSHRPDLWLPAQPMRRHHFDYSRERDLMDPDTKRRMMETYRRRTAEQATQDLGLCDPLGPGSLTHPDLTRVLYADGKVVTPLYRAKRHTRHVDKRTGELRILKADPTAKLHVTGSGEEAYGNKFVIVACRLPASHGRFILNFDWVEATGAEARVAVDAIGTCGAMLPGAQGVLYDGAFRGTHIVELLRNVGILPVSPVHALAGGRRLRKPRVEREVHVETRSTPSGRSIAIYTRAGALGYVQLDESGEGAFVPLELTKITRTKNKDRTFRWYGEYQLPAEFGGGVMRVRFDTTDEDVARGFNRSEHLRAIPPGSSDYETLYSRRSDIESINRHLDDTMWLGRAHSVGGERQLIDLLGFALVVNSVALHRYRRTAPPLAA